MDFEENFELLKLFLCKERDKSKDSKDAHHTEQSDDGEGSDDEIDIGSHVGTMARKSMMPQKLKR